jgi:Prenyltransferase and squalene oxidase repeat
MGNVDVDAYLTAARSYVASNRAQWTPDDDVDFETLNHLVRVWVQDDSIGGHLAELGAMCAAQHADGGWGDRRDELESCTRTTAFCTQMLLRANRTLGEDLIHRSVLRGLDRIVANQALDGSWRDRRWHALDATSVSVGTLIFAVNEEYGSKAHRDALERGMRYVHDARSPDGLWYHKPSASPVEITAHLLQKVGLHDPASRDIAIAIDGLLGLQHEDGHWDSRNVDSTCDALRSMMLTSELPGASEQLSRVVESAERGLAWLLSAQNEDGGHGVREGRPSTVLYTCDVIDTALKFKLFNVHAALLVNFYQ